ncbi:MAG: hypothetical protein R6V57_04260 [Vicinamibacterales bacterium]
MKRPTGTKNRRALVIVGNDTAAKAAVASTGATSGSSRFGRCAGKTTFVIAHQFTAIEHADLILVLDQGRMVERGGWFGDGPAVAETAKSGLRAH